MISAIQSEELAQLGWRKVNQSYHLHPSKPFDSWYSIGMRKTTINFCVVIIKLFLTVWVYWYFWKKLVIFIYMVPLFLMESVCWFWNFVNKIFIGIFGSRLRLRKLFQSSWSFSKSTFIPVIFWLCLFFKLSSSLNTRFQAFFSKTKHLFKSGIALFMSHSPCLPPFVNSLASSESFPKLPQEEIHNRFFYHQITDRVFVVFLTVLWEPLLAEVEKMTILR